MSSSQTTECQDGSIPCAFCNERLSSLDAMRDHLNICGNKTEYCPDCGQYIRRAILSYHLENNCLILNETDNSLEEDNDSLSSCSQHSIQTNLSNVTNQEDTSLPSGSLKQQRKPAIVICEYCRNEFSQKAYIDHKV